MTITPVLISPADLQTLLATEPVVLIDTRDADTYAAGHLPGAVNLREIFTFLASSTAEGLQALKASFTKAFGDAGLDGSQTAVFYEDALNTGYGQSCRGYLNRRYMQLEGLQTLTDTAPTRLPAVQR